MNAVCFTGRFTPAGEAVYSTDALRKHVTDAAIAAQLTPPDDAEWLAHAKRVAEAREALRHVAETAAALAGTQRR